MPRDGITVKQTHGDPSRMSWLTCQDCGSTTLNTTALNVENQNDPLLGLIVCGACGGDIEYAESRHLPSVDDQEED